MPRPNLNFRKAKSIDEKIVNPFLAKLEESIKVEALIVFGSRARSDALETSDYDVAIVSDDFEKMPKLKRSLFLLENWDADFALESVAYTKKEFAKARGLLVWDILEEGIVFKDTGIFEDRRLSHEQQKKAGDLQKVEGGWKFA